MGTCCSRSDHSLKDHSSRNDYLYQKLTTTSRQQVPHYSILLVGKTGAGKSTAINMIANLANQKQYKDPRMIAITQKVTISQKEIILRCNMPEFYNKQSDQLTSKTSESQTSKVHIYEFQGKDYHISVVDTPGLGDTRGMRVDDDNIKQLIVEVQNLFKINCILYIHRSTDLRECISLKHIFNQLKSLLPVEFKDNIVIGFTSVQNIFKIEAIPVLQDADIPVDNYVCFENDCLIHPDLMPKSSNSQSYEQFSNIFWNQNAQQFEKLIGLIEPMISKDPILLLDLFCKKQAFAKTFYRRQHKIEEIQQIKVFNNAIIANIVDVKQTLNNFTYDPSFKLVWKTTKKSKYIKKYIDVDLKEKITFCYRCCNICHNPCYLSEIYNKGDVKMKQCDAFDGGSLDKCKRCSHAPEYHGHSMKIQKQVDEELKIDFEYVEKECTQNSSQSAFNNEINQAISKLTSKEDILKKSLEEKEKEIEKDTVFIAALIKQIKDQSMSFNHSIVIEYIQEKIEKTKEDCKLTQDEKDFLILEDNEQLKYYQKLEEEIKSAENFNFAKYNQPQLEREIKQLLDEEAKTIKRRDFS